jgi:hypothetical protein
MQSPIIAPDRIAHHTSRRVAEPFPIDGNLEKAVWKTPPGPGALWTS